MVHFIIPFIGNCVFIIIVVMVVILLTYGFWRLMCSGFLVIDVFPLLLCVFLLDGNTSVVVGLADQCKEKDQQQR